MSCAAARNSSSIAACGERINLWVVCRADRASRTGRLHFGVPSHAASGHVARNRQLTILKLTIEVQRSIETERELFFIARFTKWANQSAVYSK